MVAIQYADTICLNLECIDAKLDALTPLSLDL